MDRLVAADVAGSVRDLPQTVYSGANRYDTDTEHVLHLWTASGESYDIRWPKTSPSGPHGGLLSTAVDQGRVRVPHNPFAIDCARNDVTPIEGAVCDACPPTR